MAKSGVLERDPTAAVAAATADNLKKELQRLVKAIVQDSSSDEGIEFTECIDRATETLQALKDLRVGRKHRSDSFMKLDNRNNNNTTTSSFDSCPQEFNCPLSKELMRDPVIISSGTTFDRHSIQKWLKAGNRTCPKTQQVLSHTVLTPNHLVQDMITQWCKNHGVRSPSSSPLHYTSEEQLTEDDHNLFQSLLKKLSSSSSLSEQKEAARKLRSLTKNITSFRALFGESSESILQLLNPLSQITNKKEIHIDLGLQEDLITTLLNVSIHESNKKLVAETPIVLPVILHALRSGNIETRSNAAATVFTLSALDSNKSLIGKAGALKPLIDLLEEGHTLAMKDVAMAIFNLCMLPENRGRAVQNGAVSVLLNKIKNRVHVDELLTILAMLSSNQKGIEDMSDLGAVSCLFSLIKETTCDKNKENCIVILYAICFNDRTKWKEMREEESAYGTLSELAQYGTSRAKRKANGILDRINRPVNRTHTA